jgi:arylsulfatase
MENIAVVVLDTLRKDRFDTYFQDQLPGTTLEQAYTTSHWTVPACASLFTGQYASEVGVTQSSTAIPEDVRTLPEAIQNAGYHTSMLTANPNLHLWDGWTNGFDTVYAERNIPTRADESLDVQQLMDEYGVSGIKSYSQIWLRCLFSRHPLASLNHVFAESQRSPADGFADAIAARLEDMEFESENEFLFVNIMNSHSPYRTKDNGVVDAKTGDGFANTISDPKSVVNAYDYDAERLANVYKRIHQRLENEFDVIITLSDHGECLGEYGMWNHGYGVFPELAEIPVNVWGIDNLYHGDTPISILDLHQTIAEKSGANVESRGVDISESIPDANRLVEYHGLLGWHTDQFERKGVDQDTIEKCNSPRYGIVYQDGTYVYQTYEQEWVGDGKSNRYDNHLEQILGTLETYERKKTDKKVSESAMERLEELGYA